MKINWQVKTSEQLSLKQFLFQQGISQRLYSKIKTLKLAIEINQQPSQPATVVQRGDQVSLTLPAEPADPTVQISYQPIQVLEEDDHWLVVNKPAGLATIPGPTNQSDTLLNRIKGYWQQAGQTDLVPHIITRLDFDTSGIVLVGKHQVAQSLLQPQIEKHQLQKYYLAVIAGTDLPTSGTLNQPIGRIEHQARRQVLATGQTAHTSYWLLGADQVKSAVKVQIHTGRTHQIRVHFSAIGHPLLGDQLYDGPLTLGINRQALHAVELQFTDPFTDQLRVIQAPVPSDIRAVLPPTVALLV